MHYHHIHGHSDARPELENRGLWREHGVPHFHVEGPDFRCSIGIASLELIIGSAPPRVFAAAIKWAAGNQGLLMETWQELNA